jgi:hypothetical protein
MAQTINPFLEKTIINLECNRGETIPFIAKFKPGVDVNKIETVRATGCQCTSGFLTYNDKQTGKYHDYHTQKDFEKEGNPVFMIAERYVTIYYKHPDVKSEDVDIVNDRGVLIVDPRLEWETITLKIKVNNK